MTMIVKKISYTNFSKTKARRIGDLVDYIRQPHDRNPEEKIAYAGAKNFTANNHEGQRAEMISLAERTVNYAFTVGGEMAIHQNKQAIRAWYALVQRRSNAEEDKGLRLRM